MQNPGSIISRRLTRWGSAIRRFFGLGRTRLQSVCRASGSRIRTARRSRPLFVLNSILSLGTLVIASALIFALVRPSKTADNFAASAEKVYQASSRNIPEGKSYSQYAGAFGRRQLFQSSSGGAAGFDGHTAGSSTGTAGVDDLVLVGIISGPEPVVLIKRSGEDDPNHYRLGDTITGEFTLDSIFRTRVVLSNGMQIKNLKL